MSENRETALREAFQLMASQTGAPSPHLTPPRVSQVPQRADFKDLLHRAYCSGGGFCFAVALMAGLHLEIILQANSGISAWPSLLLVVLLGVPIATALLRILIGPQFPGPRYYRSTLLWCTVGVMVVTLVTESIMALYRALLTFSLQELIEPITLLWLLDQIVHRSLSFQLPLVLVFVAPLLGVLFLFCGTPKPFLKAPWLEYPKPARVLTVAGWIGVGAAVFALTWLNSQYRSVWEESSALEIMSRPVAQRADELGRNPIALESLQPSKGRAGELHEALLALQSPDAGRDEKLEPFLEFVRETLDSQESIEPRLGYFIATAIDRGLLYDHRRAGHQTEFEREAVPAVLELWTSIAEAEGADRLWNIHHTGTLFALEHLLENAELSRGELLKLEQLLEELILSERDRNTFLAIYALQTWRSWALSRSLKPSSFLGASERTLLLYYRARLAEDLALLDTIIPEGSEQVLASHGATEFGARLQTLTLRPFRPRQTERELFSIKELITVFGLPNRLENALLATKLRLFKEQTGSYPGSLDELTFTGALTEQLTAQFDYHPEGMMKRKETPYPSTDIPNSFELR